MSTTPEVESQTAADVAVTFVETVEPTAADRTRYHAGSVWTVPAARAAELIAAGIATAVDAPIAEPIAATPAAPEEE
jgi:hypothetical protein